MKEVFISYKSEEYDEALWIKNVLETNGVSCWMAPACIPGWKHGYPLRIIG